MKQKLLTGNAAAAWGARLASVDYIPAFPITPQTEIIETIARWTASGEMPGRMTMMESEHSMITAAGAAASTGVRVFTATSSQGLMYAMEMIYTIAGWRAPFVMVNVSRGLASPITLEPDHNDIFAARDSGFLQIHCSTCQEVLDTVIMAYRIAEDRDVRIPVIVNLDGFYLSFTREPVDIPGAEGMKNFLPEYDPVDLGFSSPRPRSGGVIVLGGTPYSYFRYQHHLAMLKALEVYDSTAEEFSRCFGRMNRAVDTFMMDDAEYCFVMTGSFATKAMDAVESLRDAGWRIGLVRPRLIRPFPWSKIREALSGVKGAAIIDQNIAMGRGGTLHTEISSAMYGSGHSPLLASYINGLGGRDITRGDFHAMACEVRDACAGGNAPEPRLVFTKEELEQLNKLQEAAGNFHD